MGARGRLPRFPKSLSLVGFLALNWVSGLLAGASVNELNCDSGSLLNCVSKESNWDSDCLVGFLALNCDGLVGFLALENDASGSGLVLKAMSGSLVSACLEGCLALNCVAGRLALKVSGCLLAGSSVLKGRLDTRGGLVNRSLGSST